MTTVQKKPLPQLNAFQIHSYDRIDEELCLIDMVTREVNQNIDAYVRLANGEDGEPTREDLEELLYQALYQMRQSMNMIELSTHRIEEVNKNYFLKGASPYSSEKIKQSLRRD